MVPKVCFADPLDTFLQWLFWSLLIFFCKRIMFRYKWSQNFFNWRCVYFVWLLEYLIKKPLVPTKQVKISFIKVKSCNVLWLTLLVCISIYLNSVLGYKFFNFRYLSSGHCIYVSKNMKIRGYFLRQKGPRASKLGEYCQSMKTQVDLTCMSNTT